MANFKSEDLFIVRKCMSLFSVSNYLGLSLVAVAYFGKFERLRNEEPR